MTQTKTIAEMPRDQQDQCVGMWCYLYDKLTNSHGEPEPPIGRGIIAGYKDGQEAPRRVLVMLPCPEDPMLEYELWHVQPRFDLPRAWNPDGTPVDGQWLTGKMQIDTTIPDSPYARALNMFYGTPVLNIGLPEDQHNWRVFVTRGESLK